MISNTNDDELIQQMNDSASTTGVQGAAQVAIELSHPNRQIFEVDLPSAQPFSPLPNITRRLQQRQEQIRQHIERLQIASDDVIPTDFTLLADTTPELQRQKQHSASAESFRPVAVAIQHLQHQEKVQVRKQISSDEANVATVDADVREVEPVSKKIKRSRASIEWTVDVLNLAVHVIYTIKLWDVNARKTMKVMETRNRGVELFVQNLTHKFGVNLFSKPVWGTIENAVNKVLNMHKAQRNREKNKITGAGDADEDEIESDEERNKRMNRERFYDSMLAIRETFQEWKQVFILVNTYISLSLSHSLISFVSYVSGQEVKKKDRQTQSRRSNQSWQALNERGAWQHGQTHESRWRCQPDG